MKSENKRKILQKADKKVKLYKNFITGKKFYPNDADTKSHAVYLNRSSDFQLPFFEKLDEIEFRKMNPREDQDTFRSFDTLKTNEERTEIVKKIIKRSKS